jgi:hypothetical protein
MRPLHRSSQSRRTRDGPSSFRSVALPLDPSPSDRLHTFANHASISSPMLVLQTQFHAFNPPIAFTQPIRPRRINPRSFASSPHRRVEYKIKQSWEEDDGLDLCIFWYGGEFTILLSLSDLEGGYYLHHLSVEEQFFIAAGFYLLKLQYTIYWFMMMQIKYPHRRGRLVLMVKRNECCSSFPPQRCIMCMFIMWEVIGGLIFCMTGQHHIYCRGARVASWRLPSYLDPFILRSTVQ